MAVGHFQNVRIAQIQLVLAGSPLPLAKLHGDAAGAHLSAYSAVEIFLFGSLEHVVIFDVPAEGLQVIVVLLTGGFIGIFEDVVLQLRAALGAVPGFGQALYLSLQHGAGRHGDGLVDLFALQVAEYQSGSIEPGDLPEGGKVGHAVKVAVALLPVGEIVALDDVHLHIHGE